MENNKLMPIAQWEVDFNNKFVDEDGDWITEQMEGYYPTTQEIKEFITKQNADSYEYGVKIALKKVKEYLTATKAWDDGGAMEFLKGVLEKGLDKIKDEILK